MPNRDHKSVPAFAPVQADRLTYSESIHIAFARLSASYSHFYDPNGIPTGFCFALLVVAHLGRPWRTGTTRPRALPALFQRKVDLDGRGLRSVFPVKSAVHYMAHFAEPILGALPALLAAQRPAALSRGSKRNFKLVFHNVVTTLRETMGHPLSNA